MDVLTISVDAGETPVCACGCNKWSVKVRIERESPLVRVDRFCDLVVEPPDPQLYQQAVVLQCLDCDSTWQPQAGVSAKLGLEGNKLEPTVEAYSEGTQKQLEDGEWQEKPSGFEDGANWPHQVNNETEWTD